MFSPFVSYTKIDQAYSFKKRRQLKIHKFKKKKKFNKQYIARYDLIYLNCFKRGKFFYDEILQFPTLRFC